MKRKKSAPRVWKTFGNLLDKTAQKEIKDFYKQRALGEKSKKVIKASHPLDYLSK